MSDPVTQAAQANLEATAVDESIESSELDEAEIAEEAAAAPATEAEKKRLKKLKIKYNGKETEEELPFEIDDNPEYIDYMQRKLQLAKMGQQKAQEHATLQNQVSQFIQELKKNPRKALANPNIGVDLKQLAAEILQEEIENSQKSPEVLEKEKLEAKLKALEDERKQEKEQFRQAELQRLTDEAYERYDTAIDQALTGAKIPKSPYALKKMADYMILALDNNIDISPKDLVPIIEDEVMNDMKEMFSAMPAEALVDFVGKEVFDKMRKHNLSKPRKAAANPAIQKKSVDVGQTKAEPKKDTGVKQSYKDFFGV